MANNIEPNIKPAKLEQLHCSICEGYLSCAPIRLLPDGSNMCGRCSPLGDKDLVYREPALEMMLSDITFPCMYKQYGCTAWLLFDRTTKHEAECEYRPITCASLPYTTCSWEGSVLQIHDHFIKQHPDLVKDNAKFKIHVNEHQQGVLMVVKNNCAFIIKYLYDADTITLKYDVGYFTFNEEVHFCKIMLMNSSDANDSISLKGSKCGLYNPNFFIAENATLLDIKKFMEYLNNPTPTSIEVALMLPKCNVVNVAKFVDYDLLASNKCGKCQYYLIPPIYDYDDAIICSDCSYSCSNCKPSSDETLQNLLVGQNYPCRWRGCEFVTKGDAIHNHEIHCTYRIYRCLDSDCKITFGRSNIIKHLQSHNYQYFINRHTYKMCFNEFSQNHAFTIVKNEILCITYSNEVFANFFEPEGTLYQMKTSSVNPKVFPIIQVHFEHDHCKYTSNTFSSGSMNLLNIQFSQLPTCFRKYDQLTATIKIV